MKRNTLIVFTLIFSTMIGSCSKKSDTMPPTTPITNLLPIISTTYAWMIRQTSANVGFYIENQTNRRGATECGLCYSTSPNPTTANFKVRSGTVFTGSKFDLEITGLLPNTTYYVRAYATNDDGTGYGNQITFKTVTASSFFIGQNYQGGIIFYTNGSHGLIAYTHDMGNEDYEWGCQGELLTGDVNEILAGKGQEVGAGKSNTDSIVLKCSSSSLIAAKLCAEFEYDGYTDWFLPSIEELRWMYEARTSIGGFFSTYWSSSEASSGDYSFGIDFNDGIGYEYNSIESKFRGSANIRPIRAF